MANMIPIATVVVGSGGADTITFTSIPSTYTDLLLKVSTRSNRSGGVWNADEVTVNGSSTSYSHRFIESGDGIVTSGTNAAGYINLNSTGLLYTSTFGSSEIYIPNYTSSNNKSFSTDSVNEGNQANGVYSSLIASLWSDTSAITSITLTCRGVYEYVQYSSATLYGIRKY